MRVDKFIDFFTIIIGVLTLFAAILSFAVALLPYSRNKDRMKLKKQLEECDELKNRLEDLNAKLYYFILRTSHDLDDQELDFIINTKNSRCLNNCGVFMLNKSRMCEEKNKYLDEAINLFILALDLSKNDSNIKREIIYCNLADAYDDKNTDESFKQAFDCCKKALIYNDKCGQAYNMLAGLYIKKGKKEKARETAQKAIEYQPENGFAHLTMAETYFKEFIEAEQGKTVMSSIESALKNGCPVWKYSDDKIYDDIKKHESFWRKCDDLINKYKEQYSIAQMSLKTEYEYIL